jgi:hypothetical protein
MQAGSGGGDVVYLHAPVPLDTRLLPHLQQHPLVVSLGHFYGVILELSSPVPALWRPARLVNPAHLVYHRVGHTERIPCLLHTP